MASAVVMLLVVALAVWYFPDLRAGTVARPAPPADVAAHPPATVAEHAPPEAAASPEAAPGGTLTARTEPSGALGKGPAGTTEVTAADAEPVSHADALLARARRQRKAGDCRSAVHTYEAFLLGHRKHASAPQAMLEVARCHGRLGQRVRARHWLTQAAQHPQAAEVARKRLQELDGDSP